MKRIIEAGDLPYADKVYLKKDFLGWRVVEPPTKWYHWVLGTKRTMFSLLIIIIIAGALFLGMNEVIGQYKDIADAPCNYCIDCISKIGYNQFSDIELNELNLTDMNLTE